MKTAFKFKGGRCTMRSGGFRPDTYMFRHLPHGRYYAVTIGTVEDREALKTILRSCERVTPIDGEIRYRAGKYAGTVRAVDFLKLEKTP